MNLSKEELNEIEGGAFKLSATGIGLIAGGIAAFTIGVISGFLRPLTCSK